MTDNKSAFAVNQYDENARKEKSLSQKNKGATMYDFTTIMNRSGWDALAVDCIGADVSWAQAPTAPKNGFSAIPMWVADMNFATVPTIVQAMTERVRHPAYGYYIPTAAYYNAIIR